MYKLSFILWLLPIFGMGQNLETGVEGKFQASKQEVLSRDFDPPGPYEDLILDLLRFIRAEQTRESEDFTLGGFPSFREYQGRKGVFKKDDNVFFTALVLMTIRDHYDRFNTSQKMVADSILRDGLPSFSHFMNRKGRPTYNFWPTNPPVIFPDGGWLNLFNRPRALPDDLDATSISLLALEVPDSVASGVHDLMQLYSNNGRWALKKTFPEYDTLKVYSTWFGEKIPVDMDASVVCNILNMVNRYQLKLSAVDSSSIHFLARVIHNRHHLSDPLKISPYYGTSALVLYHYARLMENASYPALDSLKPVLIKDALEEYEKAPGTLEKIILRTALQRWGVAAPADSIIISDLQKDIGDAPFVFFIANMGVIFPDGLGHRLATGNAGRFNYYCPAYNYALLLENMMTNVKE